MYDIILQQTTKIKETKDFLHNLGIPLSDASIMASQALNGEESVILTTDDLNLIHNTVKLLHKMGCAAIIKEVP